MPTLHRFQTIKTNGLNFKENLFINIIFSSLRKYLFHRKLYKSLLNVTHKNL